MIGFRNLYVFTLCLVFFYGVYKSLMKMRAEPTTFEEEIIKKRGSLPSITFCEDTRKVNDFQTMEDVLNAIDQIKYIPNTQLYYTGKGVKYEIWDLKNSTVLKEKFKVDFDQVWNFVATVSQFRGGNIMICTSLNMSFLQLPSKGRVVLDIQSCSEKRGLRFEKHEPDQSNYNYQFNYDKGYQYYRQAQCLKI